MSMQRLWALEWAWHPAEINLGCAGSPKICIPTPNILALIDSELGYESHSKAPEGNFDMLQQCYPHLPTKNLKVVKVNEHKAHIILPNNGFSANTLMCIRGTPTP